jgi:hypothetical protein
VESQEEHHRTRSFQEEYRGFLRKYGVEFDERYVWIEANAALIRAFSARLGEQLFPGALPQACMNRRPGR